MRLKQLRGLPVIDPTAARKIGSVSDYQVDPVSGRLAALDVTPLGNGEAERVLAQRIRRVGSSAVILTARGGSAPSTTTEMNEHWLDTSATVGLEVMGDDGVRIGQLVDATFDQDTLQIDAYLLQSSFFEQLFGRRGRITPDAVHSCSRELMMVATGHVRPADEVPTRAEAEEPRMPLKEEDRAAVPTFEPVPDGQPVATRR
jgi:uncharacterized protein YrrD